MSTLDAPWEGKDDDRQWWGRDNLHLVDELSGFEHWWDVRDSNGRSAWMAAIDNQAGDGTLWNIFRRTQQHPAARYALDDHDHAGASVLAHALRHTAPPQDSSGFDQQIAWLKILNEGQKSHRNPKGEGLLMQLHHLSVRAGCPGKWCDQGPPLNMISHVSTGADLWVEGLGDEVVQSWLENGALRQVDQDGPARSQWESNPRLLRDWLIPQYQHHPSGRWQGKLRSLLDLGVTLARYETLDPSKRTPEKAAALWTIAEQHIKALLPHMPHDDIVGATLTALGEGDGWAAKKRDLEAQWLGRGLGNSHVSAQPRRL